MLTEAVLFAMCMRKDGIHLLVMQFLSSDLFRSYPDPENPSERKELVVKLCEYILAMDMNNIEFFFFH